MSFSEQYRKILNIVQEDLSLIETELISSIDLSPSMDEALQSFLSNKPKRIRPLVALLYLRAVNVNPTAKHYSFLTAIEIIHNASLIHDDVVDEAETRRGNKTFNKIFNNKTAILTGDYLLSVALEKLNSLNSPKTIAMCANTLKEMCRGEVNQYFNKFKITSIEEYLKKTEQKTAKLFQTAVCGAMTLSGKNDLDAPEIFSRAFGMAFQIRDDILNITRRETLKPSQNDIKSGIYNAPVIFADKTSNLDEGIEKSKTLLDNYIIEAKNTLEISENNKYNQALRNLLGILGNV